MRGRADHGFPVNVTGKWVGTWKFEPISLGGGQVVADLKQVGASTITAQRQR